MKYWPARRCWWRCGWWPPGFFSNRAVSCSFRSAWPLGFLVWRPKISLRPTTVTLHRSSRRKTRSFFSPFSFHFVSFPDPRRLLFPSSGLCFPFYCCRRYCWPTVCRRSRYPLFFFESREEFRDLEEHCLGAEEFVDRPEFLSLSPLKFANGVLKVRF